MIWTLAVLLAGLHLLLLFTTLCTCDFERQIKRRAKTKRESPSSLHSTTGKFKYAVMGAGSIRSAALLCWDSELRPCDYKLTARLECAHQYSRAGIVVGWSQLGLVNMVNLAASGEA